MSHKNTPGSPLPDKSKRPNAGIGVFVWRDGKVIVYRRSGSHGASTWTIPGGHIEYGESWAEAARRETLEEVGVEITNVRFLTAANDIFEKEGKHYVTIWVESDWLAGEPTSMEPEKVIDVQWRSLDDLPTPLFEPCWTNLHQAVPEFFTRHGAQKP